MHVKKFLYQVKNHIKYTLKRKITVDELHHIQRLVNGGYVNKKTYNKLSGKLWKLKWFERRKGLYESY